MNMKSNLTILCALFLLLYFFTDIFDDEVGPNTLYSCRYYSDHKENRESMPIANPTLPQDQKSGVVGMFQIASDLYDMASSATHLIDNDYIFISVRENGKNEKELAKSLKSKLKNREIVPKFYYSGLLSNFYEMYDYDDIETPFGERDKRAKDFEFVLRKKSVKSRLVYFGLEINSDVKERYFILWHVDQNTNEARLATPEEYASAKQFVFN